MFWPMQTRADKASSNKHAAWTVWKWTSISLDRYRPAKKRPSLFGDILVVDLVMNRSIPSHDRWGTVHWKRLHCNVLTRTYTHPSITKKNQGKARCNLKSHEDVTVKWSTSYIWTHWKLSRLCLYCTVCTRQCNDISGRQNWNACPGGGTRF